MDATQNNIVGTRQAKAKAVRRSALPRSRRISNAPKDTRQSPAAAITANRLKNGVGAGYGGMGYGPTAQDGMGYSPTTQKALQRANPTQLTRQVLDSIATPKTVRAQGSIWDDPVYGNMANEHGAEFAMKARNLDRQINQAHQMQDIRKNAMQHNLDMEQMKLQANQLERANQYYAPPDETIGADRKTGLAVDANGAFTGKGEQQRVLGKGPMSAAESAQIQRDFELKKEGIGALTQALRAELGKDYSLGTPEEQKAGKDRIQGLMDQLNNILGSGNKEAAPAKKEGGKQSVTGPDGKDYSIGDTLPNGHTLSKIYDDGTIEVK